MNVINVKLLYTVAKIELVKHDSKYYNFSQSLSKRFSVADIL